MNETRLAFSIMDIIEPAIQMINDRLERVQLSQAGLESSLDQVNEQLNLYCEWISPDGSSVNDYNSTGDEIIKQITDETANISIADSNNVHLNLENEITDSSNNWNGTNELLAHANKNNSSKPNLSNYVLSEYPDYITPNSSSDNLYEYRQTTPKGYNSPKLSYSTTPLQNTIASGSHKSDLPPTSSVNVTTPADTSTPSNSSNGVDTTIKITNASASLSIFENTPNAKDTDDISIKSYSDIKSPLNVSTSFLPRHTTASISDNLNDYKTNRNIKNHLKVYNEYSISDPYLPRKPSSTISTSSLINNYGINPSNSQQRLFDTGSKRTSRFNSNTNSIYYNLSDPDFSYNKPHTKEQNTSNNSHHLQKITLACSKLDSARKRLADVNSVLKQVQRRLNRISTLAQTKIAQKRLVI
ncbi:hypothetical protein AYI69_g345 [Smittium culicis]|uniref:Uncharacterized protein n=1 Tax=Smittium culicis TaxID=133412 RepID=A0A1R1YTA6_9FUNG|nr:hypothetical protein AYI69_g345 [Smittium culicis]